MKKKQMNQEIKLKMNIIQKNRKSIIILFCFFFTVNSYCQENEKFLFEDSVAFNYKKNDRLVASKIFLVDDYCLLIKYNDGEEIEEISYYNNLGEIVFKRELNSNQVNSLSFFNKNILSYIAYENGNNTDMLKINDRKITVIFDDKYHIKSVKIVYSNQTYKWMIFENNEYKHTVYW